jgi:single-strand DNA-binding protein
MADVNHVILIGRLTRDAELKYTSGGVAVCKFSIANNKRRKQGEQWVDEVHYFDIVSWGRTGETLNQYLVKGKQVAIDGEICQNRWEHEGKLMSKVEVKANSIQLLGGTDKAPREQPQGATPEMPPDDASPADFPDDIPF